MATKHNGNRECWESKDVKPYVSTRCQLSRFLYYWESKCYPDSRNHYISGKAEKVFRGMDLRPCFPNFPGFCMGGYEVEGMSVCPECGSSIVEVDAPPPHYAKRECIGVDHHFHGWVETPWTLERAAQFVLPFGKHKGATMERVAEADYGYVQWLAANVKGNARRAAEIVLRGTI